MIRHFGLLFLTFVTTTIAGTLFPFGRLQTLPDSDPQNISEVAFFFFTLPIRYFLLVSTAIANIASNTDELIYGLSFSLSLLFILISHEMGHYIACRIYGVEATLPYFIPVPPMIGPAGTFGAFIKIQSPMPSRRAVFDIGVAGPIAGFLALIPIAIIGVATAERVSPERYSVSGLSFSDPIMMKIIKGVVGIDLNQAIENAFYFAAWVGLLVTALNLIPSGQLDGGHAIYAVFGEKVHKWTGAIAFVFMATLSGIGLFFYSSPSGLLVAALLAVMMRVRHPEPYDQSPLDKKRKAVAFLTLIIFGLCFLPFPVKIN